MKDKEPELPPDIQALLDSAPHTGPRLSPEKEAKILAKLDQRFQELNRQQRASKPSN